MGLARKGNEGYGYLYLTPRIPTQCQAQCILVLRTAIITVWITYLGPSALL